MYELAQQDKHEKSKDMITIKIHANTHVHFNAVFSCVCALIKTNLQSQSTCLDIKVTR